MGGQPMNVARRLQHAVIAEAGPYAELGEAMAGLAHAGGSESLLVSGIVVDDPFAPELAGRIEVELVAAPEGLSLGTTGGSGVKGDPARAGM